MKYPGITHGSFLHQNDKKLQKLISSISHMSMAEQHDLLEEAFISWRGKHEQVDDVCVIGVRV